MRTDNEQVYSLDIEVLYSAKVTLNPSWRYKNVKSYFSRLYFVKSGNGYLIEDGKKIPLQANSVYLIPSEHCFSYGCESLEKIFFHILLPVGQKTDVLAEAGKILVLPDSAQIVTEIYDAYGKNDIQSVMQIKMLLFQTLNQMTQRYGLQFDGGHTLSPLTTAALHYIWSRVSIRLSAREIASKLYVSESTLRNTFKKETGVALGTYVDDAVFFTVRKMIGAGFRIDEIAAKLQFCDRHYLSRRFKETFGKTISEYKKEQPESSTPD